MNGKRFGNGGTQKGFRGAAFPQLWCSCEPRRRRTSCVPSTSVCEHYQKIPSKCPSMYSVVAHHTYRRHPKAPSTTQQEHTSVPTPDDAHDTRKPALYQRIYRYVKKQFSSEVEDDHDEFHFHITRYRPEEIEKLASTTKFTKKEIQLIYRGFKQEAPTGLVDEESFKHIFAQFFPQGDATNYAHYVFNTMKQKHTGKISFEDFLHILSKVSRGTVEEKMQWVFGLYDLNGDGLISKPEMVEVVTSIYEMLGKATIPLVEDTTAKDHVEKIFHLIDTNQDGVVTIDELMDWCSRDESILQSFNMLDTVL